MALRNDALEVALSDVATHMGEYLAVLPGEPVGTDAAAVAALAAVVFQLQSQGFPHVAVVDCQGFAGTAFVDGVIALIWPGRVWPSWPRLTWAADCSRGCCGPFAPSIPRARAARWRTRPTRPQRARVHVVPGKHGGYCAAGDDAGVLVARIPVDRRCCQGSRSARRRRSGGQHRHQGASLRASCRRCNAPSGRRPDAGHCCKRDERGACIRTTTDVVPGSVDPGHGSRGCPVDGALQRHVDRAEPAPQDRHGNSHSRGHCRCASGLPYLDSEAGRGRAWVCEAHEKTARLMLVHAVSATPLKARGPRDGTAVEQLEDIDSDASSESAPAPSSGAAAGAGTGATADDEVLDKRTIVCTDGAREHAAAEGAGEAMCACRHGG